MLLPLPLPPHPTLWEANRRGVLVAVYTIVMFRATKVYRLYRVSYMIATHRDARAVLDSWWKEKGDAVGTRAQGPGCPGAPLICASGLS